VVVSSYFDSYEPFGFAI